MSTTRGMPGGDDDARDFTHLDTGYAVFDPYSLHALTFLRGVAERAPTTTDTALCVAERAPAGAAGE